jgi:hypothetical protein
MTARGFHLVRPVAGAPALCAVVVIAACGLALCAFNAAFAEPGDFILVRRSLEVQDIRLRVIDEQTLTHFEHTRPESRVPLPECIALINPSPRSAVTRGGMLVLSDGQRLPGEPASAASSAGDPPMFAWVHPQFGRIDVPVADVQQVLLRAESSAEDLAHRGRADLVILANGDRLEGIVSALGESVTIDPLDPGGGSAAPTTVPLEVVASITMVAPRKPATGRRIWFADGTVLDVRSIVIGDDGYVRLSGSALVSGTQAPRVGLDEITAILLDPGAMIPLATLTPSRVEGPPTRYVVPRPRLLDPAAPLELSPLEFRGPVVARYALPVACTRFAAQAELPPSAHQWGDFQLVIRSDDKEVFRVAMNADNPLADVNVPLSAGASGGGRELTIELASGAHGPIQDQVILRRAMLLKKP